MFEFGFLGGWQGVESFSSHQAQTEKVWTPADEMLSPLGAPSNLPLQTNITKELVILVIVTNMMQPLDLLVEVQFVSCCRWSAGKKVMQVYLSPSPLGNREFCASDFQRTVETTDRVA